MGYSTDFDGVFTLNPPLSLVQHNTLTDFAERDHRDDSGMPGYYCEWVPTKDGTGLEWDGGEKFYAYSEWLQYLIDTFLKPWGISLNGEVDWNGEQRGDAGTITVVDNVVTVKAIGRGHR